MLFLPVRAAFDPPLRADRNYSLIKNNGILIERRIIMPRLKGSKNKKKNIDPLISLADQIVAKRRDIEMLTAEIDGLSDSVAELKRELRNKKAKLKIHEKELTDLQAAKAAQDEAEKAAALKAEAEKIVETAIASGKSAQEIMKLLGAEVTEAE
jgi:polyhydroxyalkanoate synthesis regulator phasin